MSRFPQRTVSSPHNINRHQIRENHQESLTGKQNQHRHDPATNNLPPDPSQINVNTFEDDFLHKIVVDTSTQTIQENNDERNPLPKGKKRILENEPHNIKSTEGLSGLYADKSTTTKEKSLGRNLTKIKFQKFNEAKIKRLATYPIANKPNEELINASTTKTLINIKTTEKNKFLPGVVMDRWIDTCMNITTWHNRWFPLFPKIPQESEIVTELSDNQLIMGSLLRRVYGYIHVQESGLYNFQLKTHEGAEVLIADTGMSLQGFKDPLSVDEVKTWKELLYLNVTLEEMKEQKIFQRGVMIHYKSPVKTIDLAKDRVYHIEILQGGRFYAEYSLMWKPRHETTSVFNKITSPALFHTKRTNSRSLLSLLWLKNPPQENYPYTREEQNRLDYHKRPVFNISEKLSSTLPKCPKTSWYKRNITRLYLGRLFVDYHLVYPRNHFDYTGGWPLEHLMLNEAKAWMIANKTLDRLREMHKRYFH